MATLFALCPRPVAGLWTGSVLPFLIWNLATIPPGLSVFSLSTFSWRHLRHGARLAPHGGGRLRRRRRRQRQRQRQRWRRQRRQRRQHQSTTGLVSSAPGSRVAVRRHPDGTVRVSAPAHVSSGRTVRRAVPDPDGGRAAQVHQERQLHQWVLHIYGMMPWNFSPTNEASFWMFHFWENDRLGKLVFCLYF